jgi:hypothetical protein
MSKASEEAGVLYNQFLVLEPQARAAFLSLLRGTGELKSEKLKQPPERLPAMLYSRIAEKLYSYQGIKLPPLAALQKTSAEEELVAALHWLSDGKKMSLEERTGLLELTAETMAREVRWGNSNTRTDAKTVVRLLARIPSAVDAAFPGYRMHGMLLAVAAKIGSGELPIVKEET